MADARCSSSTKDSQKSRRAPETGNGRKRPKLDPATFTSDLAVMVTIMAYRGPDTTEFKVNREVACLHAPVFRAAFNSRFVEGKTQTYHLEDTTKLARSFFVQYLYCQKLEIVLKNGPEMQEDFALVELWALADMLRIPKLQNLALTSLKILETGEGKRHVIAYHCINAFYDRTSFGSMLHRFYVENCGVYADGSIYREMPEKFLVEMLRELAEFLTDRVDDVEKTLMETGERLPRFSVEDYFVLEE
ncbi:hypothetical protein BKA65DRAFT_571900 [Rhexocercosporidium sp. MPI-PUGE-AT-0058]|nr:hypothetical protein BKA65DRAFT_571900 [Rhexocercosporidium sp. MPI-PUGE-AT-0058]